MELVPYPGDGLGILLLQKRLMILDKQYIVTFRKGKSGRYTHT